MKKFLDCERLREMQFLGNTVQCNNVPWLVPCAKKISIPFFCHYFDENHMKDMKIKKKLYYY